MCTKWDDCEWRVGELKTYLVVRAYNEGGVSSKIGKAMDWSREDLLVLQVINKRTGHPFSGHLPSWSSPFNMHFSQHPMCYITHHCKYGVHYRSPPIVAYRRPPNLRDRVIRTVHSQIKETYEGNSWCNQLHCKTCSHMRTGTTFHSTTTSERFKVKVMANCQTKNVVYVIECTKCSIQYVGETENAVHVRLTGHWSDIRHKCMEEPVTNHFNSVDHPIKDLTFVVIEAIHREHTEYRRRKESHWIQMIRSLASDGLNLYL